MKDFVYRKVIIVQVNYFMVILSATSDLIQSQLYINMIDVLKLNELDSRLLSHMSQE